MIKKYLKKHRKTLIISGIVLMAAAGLLGVYIWHWEVRPHVLEVHVFPADTVIAVFIRTPDNHTILVDGGKTNAIIRTLTSLMPFYRRTIDTVILTKNDDAHVAGLVDVLNRYHVGQVVEMADVISVESLRKIASTSTAYLEFSKIITDKHIHERKVSGGDHISLEDGAYGEVSSDILFPPSTGFMFSKTNLPQLALRISYGGTSFVVGDLSKTEQKYIITAASSSLSSSSAISSLSALTSADVLISQHAGGTSTMNENFFNALRPDYVVISKKPTVPKVLAASSASSASASTASIVQKPKKPKKPPFSIFNVVNTKIVNLAIDGGVEFISDGNRVTR